MGAAIVPRSTSGLSADGLLVRRAWPLARRLGRSSLVRLAGDVGLRAKEGSGMSINTYRGLLYKLARIMGDVNAAQKGKIGRRVARRAVGRLTGRGLGRLFR